MHLSVLFSSILLFAVAAVQAHSGMVKVHVVQVGLKSTLTFSPESIQADPGDMVQFQFHQKVKKNTNKNHVDFIRGHPLAKIDNRITPSFNQPSILRVLQSTRSCQM